MDREIFNLENSLPGIGLGVLLWLRNKGINWTGFLFVVILVGATSVWGQDDVEDAVLNLHTQNTYQTEDIIPFIVYKEDPDHSMTIDNCCSDNNATWQALQQNTIDFGFSPAKFWLKLSVKNDNGTKVHWILDLNSRFMNGLDVYLIKGELVERILWDSEQKPFNQRDIQYRQLAVEFSLQEKEEADIVIAYWSRGTTVLPLAIETEKSFYQHWIAENIYIVAFYSAMAFMIIFGLAQFVILKKSVQLTYALYVWAGGLYVFHMDGLSFQYLWPHWPQWNADASLLLGLNIGIFSVIFSRTFLNTKLVMPKVDKLLQSILVFIVLLMLATFVMDLRGYKQYAFLVTTTAIFVCMITGIFAYLRGQKEARFYVLGWVGLFLSAGFASVSHLFETLLPIPLTFDFAKVGIFADGIMFAMAMADQANEVRKQRDLAHARERVLLEQDLEAQKQLTRLEQQYQSALSLAQEKSHALASAGHDLRQPIVALKAAMMQVTEREDADASTINQFKQGFSYIENLIKEYLQFPQELQRTSTKTQSKESTDHHDKPYCNNNEKNDDETFPIAVVLNNIESMFRDMADNNNIALSCLLSSALIKANPIVVMRILSNLTENALKYTREGKVVIGCRRRKDHLDVQVWDTGPGFSDSQRQEYFTAYQRGNNKDIEGLGLGLAIVHQLAQAHDYNLILCSRLGKGSMFQFSLPLAQER